jgi:hypothetical protein
MGFTHFNKVGIGFPSVLQFTEPPMSSGLSLVDSTFTVPGALANAAYAFSPAAALSTAYQIGAVWSEAADEVRVRFVRTGDVGSSISGSTNRGYLTQFSIPSSGPVYSS